MMSGQVYYETDQALCEYLLFHYGLAEEVLPWSFGPRGALDYPARCISECLDRGRLPVLGRGLDLGCAVGRSTFEMARHCGEVVGIDFSQAFIDVARHLKARGSITYSYVEEGKWLTPATAVVPADLDRDRVSFEQGDAQALRPTLGRFDVVLMANLVDRLREPRRCLEALPELVVPGGQLILTSPYTWLEAYTPREQWLGGIDRWGSGVRAFDTLKAILEPWFELAQVRDLPFLIREHARKYQWSVAQGSTWVRRA